MEYRQNLRHRLEELLGLLTAERKRANTSSEGEEKNEEDKEENNAEYQGH